MSTTMPKANDISRKWYVLDADGVALGRIAAKAARITSYNVCYTKLLRVP